MTGIANYGPTATLFTRGPNHTVQQYDVNPAGVPLLVASAQHMPANTPPTPPTSLEEAKNPYNRPGATAPRHLPGYSETESSADEANAMSPLQRIAKEMDSLDQMEDELRDKVMPLSPSSSQTSSVSSRSSGRARRAAKYLYDRPTSSRASTLTGTEFSMGPPIYSAVGQSAKPGHDSTRSISSVTSGGSRYRSSQLSREVLRSPQKSAETANAELFPYAKARLLDVPFRTPHYGNGARTAKILQREMLSTVFGWNDDVRSLIHDEFSRHKPGSASSVLLSKWLGDVGPDALSTMVGSESMTSSDWMLLALSSIGAESQKKVGEAFVQRLLEKGDVHPAVAILLGLGEHNEAIEVYVSLQYIMEAVLLTCLTRPSDWQRQALLVRKWGEVAVREGQPELAVRCFSCISIETSGPWTSPRAQNEAFAAQQQHAVAPLTSPPLSPPSAGGSTRKAPKNASLKLITNFGDKGAAISASDSAAINTIGITPIAESALSPRGQDPWMRPPSRQARDPSSARTATPGGYGRRKRIPSRNDIDRAKKEASDMLETPIAASHDYGRPRGSTPSANNATPFPQSTEEPLTAVKPTASTAFESDIGSRIDDDQVASPLRGGNTGRSGDRSSGQWLENLAARISDVSYSNDTRSPSLSTDASMKSQSTNNAEKSQAQATADAVRTRKARAVDDYINSVEEARNKSRQRKGGSRSRDGSRRRGGSRARSRPRDPVDTGFTHYIQPSKRSPSSPIPMSPEEIAQATRTGQTTSEDESFYMVMTPVEGPSTGGHGMGFSHLRSRADSNAEPKAPSKSASRGKSRARDPGLLRADSRGRKEQRTASSTARFPSSPLPMSPEKRGQTEDDGAQSEGQRVRLRSQSASKRTGGDLQTRRAASRSRGRDGSRDRNPATHGDALKASNVNMLTNNAVEGTASESSMSTHSESNTGRPGKLSRKELAAKELEERRLSLARRPSAPAIPMPGEFGGPRPSLGPRAHTEISKSPHATTQPPIPRSQTVDPAAAFKFGKTTGKPNPPTAIGLPATPRAMKHPQYLTADFSREGARLVPELPETISNLTGSSLSQLSNSFLSQNSSVLPRSDYSKTDLSRQDDISEVDSLGPLLPSTVYGQSESETGPRSASAPPVDKSTAGSLPAHPTYKVALPSPHRRLSLHTGHARKISPPEHNTGIINSPASIDEALHQTQSPPEPPLDQIIVVDSTEGPPMLPELQHLAEPPPPPPPPTMYSQAPHDRVSTVAFAVNEEYAQSREKDTASLPRPMERANTSSPTLTNHRSRGSASESFGSRIRGVTERMRSTSRSRAKSPPQEARLPPYESVLPPLPSHRRRESVERVKSPYEQAMSTQNGGQQIPPPPPAPLVPPSPGNEGRLNEFSIPPSGSSLPPSRNGSALGMGYRNPKEIRANMPPDYIQQGAHPVQGGFL